MPNELSQDNHEGRLSTNESNNLLMPKTINSKMILNKPHLIYLKITINKVKLN